MVDLSLALDADHDWGWCRSCQSLYSFASVGQAWSCPAGGRHNRNADGDLPEQRSGRYALQRLRSHHLASISDDEADSARSGLVAHWPFVCGFDETVGGRSSSFVGSPSPVVDERERAAVFAGGGLQVRDPQFDLATDLTVSMWLRPDAEQPQNAVLIDHRSGIGSSSARERATDGFSLFINSGRLGVQLADGVTAQNYLDDAASIEMQVPRWTMLTVVVGAELHVYVDGTLAFSVDHDALGARSKASRDAGSADFVIGRHQAAEGPGFRGLIADLRISAAESTDEEVADLYARSAPLRQPAPALDGWLECRACGLLVLREPGGATPGGCQALGSGRHAVEASIAFLVGPDTSDDIDDELSVDLLHPGWTRCGTCSAIFFEPFVEHSACGAGGTHVGTGERLGLRQVVPPDFAAIDRRRGGGGVLFLGANKAGHTVLELEDEKRYLLEATDQSAIDVRGQTNASADMILRELRDNAPSFVQFSAHGSSSDEDHGLWLDGSDEPLSAADLADIFKTAASDSPHHPLPVVILNACQSAPIARAIAPHVKSVIAVEGDIPDEAAVFFTPLLYEQLARGATIHDALETARGALSSQAHFDLSVIPNFVEAAP